MDEETWTTICFKRENRNQLLKDSDKYLILDYPITNDKIELVKEYRQKLRDYMDLDEVKNYIFSNNISLPNFPEFPF